MAYHTVEIQLIAVFEEFGPVRGNHIIGIDPVGDVCNGHMFTKNFLRRIYDPFAHLPFKSNSFVHLPNNQAVEEIKGAKSVFPYFSDVFKKGNILDPFHVKKN